MRSTAPRALTRALGALFGLALLAGCSDTLLEPGAEAPLAPGRSASRADLATTPAGHIRIGVVPSATAVTLGSAGTFSLTDRVTGEVLAAGTDGEVTVELASASTPRTRDWLQIVCTGLASRRDQLLGDAAAAGFETHTETVFRADGSVLCYRVLYGTLAAGSSDAARGDFQARLAAAGLASTGLWRTITLVDGETKLRVIFGGTSTVVIHPVLLTSSDGRVTIDGAPYRGVAEVWINSGGTLAGINELPLEEYLYGVVPWELPPVPYGEPEAQKAQAIAARTYALANLGKRRADGYDLLPTTGDQVYGGLAAEHPVSSAAVDATAGVVAVHEGGYAATLFHSTSGGLTANNEDVFSSGPVAYLRGVPDAQRGEALEHVPSLEVFKRHANPTNLRAHAEGDFEADWSRYHRWVVTWSREEMARALSRGFGKTVTEVHSVEVTDRADLGRVREIRFLTDAGELVGTKDGIRTRLPYVTSTGDLSSLRSTLFFIEPQVDPQTKAVVGWIAYGGGWGHGVGMSQTGAVGMAEKGATHEEILKHYYRGISLETR